MGINQSELEQHEFEKMLENIRRDSNRNPSVSVFRIVESIKDVFFHDTLELLEKQIDEILADYDICKELNDSEKILLIADLYEIAEKNEFKEMARLTSQKLLENGIDDPFAQIKDDIEEE